MIPGRSLLTAGRTLISLIRPHPESSTHLGGPFVFDPDKPGLPALHETVDLPRVLTAPIDSYVYQRDRGDIIHPRVRAVDDSQRRAMRSLGIMTVPGWGNFTFGARALNFAQATTGHTVTHLSVSKDGTITPRGNFKITGQARVALCPEWINELPTVIHRLWYSKRLEAHQHQQGTAGIPERYLIVGHSKGGNLVYLLACLRQSHRDGTLSEFISRLKNSAGQPVLGVVPLSVLQEVAQGLNDDLLGTIGSPLYGIHEEFASFADLHLLAFGFNRLTGDSGAYFSERSMQGLHKMTGYKPSEVLDFVKTTELHPEETVSRMLLRGARNMASLKNPVGRGANLMFKGLGQVIARSPRHDGISPATYPEPFPHHIHVVGESHLDQVEKVSAMHGLFAALIERGLLR